MNDLLDIHNLHATVEGKNVLRGVTLRIPEGELHVLMGPNGSGKSSLALTLLGHPRYSVLRGTIRFGGTSLVSLKTHERARLGIFLAFQHPVAIPGVSVANVARTASKHLSGVRKMDARTFRTRLTEVTAALQLPASFTDRSINDGFSGGEKKQSEIVQMAVLAPRLVILDEPDSGLDIDALKRIATIINQSRGQKRTTLVITHYERLLQYIRPDAVHVMIDGKIIRSGGAKIATELEQSGYQSFQNTLAA